MNDNKLLKIILKDLQNLNEKKKKKHSKPFKDQDGDGKITRKDVLLARGVDLDEEKGEECPACGHIAKGDDTNCEMCNEPLKKELDEKSKSAKVKCPNCGAMNERSRSNCHNCGASLASVKENLEEKRKKRKKRKKKQVKHDPNYGAPEGSKRDAQLDRARRAYQRGDVKAAARIRRNMEKKERSKKGYKNVKRSDTGIYTESKQLNELNELINDMVEEQLLDEMLNDLEQHLDEKKKRKKKKKGGGLSAAVKKSLDKKADRRCLTRGSVYSEFRKGLAAYLSSGSRKGMSAHQWAHARVNSANPSKSWATVKKRKTCPKKKKK